MPESGGPATQAGIYYQNTVAALALADLLDLDQRIARERVQEVQVEAPESVDDIVLRFADGHHDYQSVKLTLRVGSEAWQGLWQNLSAQRGTGGFGATDQLTIVVNERNAASDAVAGLCERAASYVDSAGFALRLGETHQAALASIGTIVGGTTAAFELLRRTRLLHLPQDAIVTELSRRRFAGQMGAPPNLLPILRDLVGGAARRRGLFRPAPLRRTLKLEHGILLGEPPEWGLAVYRTATRQLARLDVPGTAVSGSAEEMFVWPRARSFDSSRPSDFESENADLLAENEDTGIDLRAFPADQFDRVVVVAGPGYGKSALLTALAGQLADGPFVPVVVPLASLAAANSSVIQFLSSTMSQELELTADWERLAEQGLLVLLFDGLDEVPTTSRPALMQRLSNFSVRYPHAPWMLTVRDAAVLSGMPQANVVELLALNDADIERFAFTMHSHLGGLTPWEVVLRLRLYPDLDRLARIPLFLVMLLATTNLDDPKPLTRADLIEAYLSTLFSPERRKATGASDDRGVALRAIAETLAFERLERQEIGATEREVREVINRFASGPAEAEALMERLRTNGILKPQSAVRLQFPYPIVQEYLAARHLIESYPESLNQRIEDAIQRPWAQVIQFALELHPDPQTVIEAMLARRDDAFATGLRLVGRCVANGARVSDELRLRIGERLVDYWVSAPSESRERVGRVLADGFADLSSTKLEQALHHRSLIEHGAGDILTRRGDQSLTLSVLRVLLDSDRAGSHIYHTFKYALRAAGDAALRVVIAAMDPNERDAKSIIGAAGMFWNFTPQSISRALPLGVARDARLPRQARLRAYKLVGAPVEEAGVALAIEAFEDGDWDRNYAAADLIDIHADPPVFLESLLRKFSIPVERRRDLAASIGRHIVDPFARRDLARKLISDASVDDEVRIVLRLMEARYGDRETYEALIDDFPSLPIEHVATTIALLGHYPDRELAGRAAALTRQRAIEPEAVVRLSASLTTGLKYVFEMDWGFGGLLKAAPPHPGISAWIALAVDWSERPDLGARDRLEVRTAGAGLGGGPAEVALEQDLLAITDFDAPIWCNDDELGHTISSALHQICHRLPVLPDDFIERVLKSTRYNIASLGVRALSDRGDERSLRRLIDLHGARSDWSVRDLAANKIELLAARLQLVVHKDGRNYRLA